MLLLKEIVFVPVKYKATLGRREKKPMFLPTHICRPTIGPEHICMERRPRSCVKIKTFRYFLVDYTLKWKLGGEVSAEGICNQENINYYQKREVEIIIFSQTFLSDVDKTIVGAAYFIILWVNVRILMDTVIVEIQVEPVIAKELWSCVCYIFRVLLGSDC